MKIKFNFINENDEFEISKNKKNSIFNKEIINNNILNSYNNRNDILSNNNFSKNIYDEDYSKWLNWNENSCRWDSFFFIYCNVILNEIKDINKTNNIICLNNIAEKLLTLNENDKYSYFWDCILKYKLDDIGTMSECNNPKAFDSNTSIYKIS